jgi:GNAT superfamily N-acetyltransferase
MNDESFSGMAWDVAKSTGMGALTGAIFGAIPELVPAGPSIKIPKGDKVLSKMQETVWEAPRETKAVLSPLRAAVTLAVMDKIRSGVGEWFTIDDVVQGIKDGSIDKKELAERSFDYLMDMYFSTHIPSMKKQLEAFGQKSGSRFLDEAAKLNPREIEKTILDVADRVRREPHALTKEEFAEEISKGEEWETYTDKHGAVRLRRIPTEAKSLFETYVEWAKASDRIEDLRQEAEALDRRSPERKAKIEGIEVLGKRMQALEAELPEWALRYGMDHEAIVREAAADGKPIPPDVLKEYGIGEAGGGSNVPKPLPEGVSIEYDSPNNTFWAMKEGKAVGSYEVEPQKTGGFWGQSIAVDEGYRRQGIATALMNEAINKLGDRVGGTKPTEQGGKFLKSVGELPEYQKLDADIQAEKGGKGKEIEPTKRTLRQRLEELDRVGKDKSVTLQSAAIPGLKEFAERDLIPTALQLGRDLKDTYQRLKRTMIPRAGVARSLLDKIMEMKGDRDKAEFVLERTTRKIEKKFRTMKNQEQIDFIDRMKRGEKQPTTELQQVADMMRVLDDGLFKEIQQYAPDVHWLEDHYRILWKVLPKPGKRKPRGSGRPFMGLFTKPLEGTEGFLQEHTLDDMSEGINAGGVPYTYNPMLMFRLHYADAMKFITANRMWNGLLDTHARLFVKHGEKPPDDFTRIDDKISRVYFPITGKPTGSTGKENQYVIAAGEWYVEKGAARLLNNYLSWDIRRRPWAKTILGIKNFTTSAELSFSAFHAVFETIESVGSGIGLGMRKSWNTGVLQGNLDGFKEGFKDILTSPYTPIENAKLGGDVIKYITNKNEFLNTTRGHDFIKRFPEAEVLINDLFLGGGKLAMHQDYKIETVRTLREELTNNNYIGAALRSIPALNEIMMKPLFETYIPRLKIGMFLKEYSNVLAERQTDIHSGKLTRAEAARTVWDFVENRLGEMNFDNLFWDKTFKTSLQILIRSVTWKLGNIRSFGRAITEQSKEFHSAFKEQRLPRMEQEMSWVWGMAATTAAMSTIIQYAFTGKMPDEMIDFVYPKIDKEGNRITLPTYARDLFTLVHSPLGYVWHSLSGMWGRFVDVVQNKDFYGVQVHDPEDNYILQRVQDLVHMVPTPFGITSTIRLMEEGEPMERQTLSFLGFTKAPYYIEQTTAEQRAGELVQQYMTAKPRTAEEFERSKRIKKYATEIQRALKVGEPIDRHVKDITADVKAGRLRLDDVDRISGRMREPLIAKTKRLSLSDAFHVWDVANDEEREKLVPVIAGKIDRARSPEELKELKPKIEKFVQTLR